jgi:lipooligosaccharide transport system permease protein
MTELKTAWTGAPALIDFKKSSRFGAWFVAEYRIRNMMKWWAAIVAFGLGNPVLYLLSVGIGIGALVDKNLGPNAVEGVSYLTFLAPALLASAAINAAMDETSFPTIEGFVWEKTFFGMNSTSLTGRQITGGVLIASLARCVFTVLLYLGALLMFGAIPLSSVVSLTFASIFAGMSFACVMLAATAFIKDDDGFFAIVGRFVITPMFMFSGTFYPIETLPIYLQWIGWISPLWHATNLGRALSYGHPVDGWLIIVHVVYLVAMMAVGYHLAQRQFVRRLAK